MHRAHGSSCAPFRKTFPRSSSCQSDTYGITPRGVLSHPPSEKCSAFGAYESSLQAARVVTSHVAPPAVDRVGIHTIDASVRDRPCHEYMSSVGGVKAVAGFVRRLNHLFINSTVSRGRASFVRGPFPSHESSPEILPGRRGGFGRDDGRERR